MKPRHWLSVFGLCVLPFVPSKAFGLPAFALRENAPCELCHTNGSAPHLTRYGFMYRRAGYRNPGNIGNVDADKEHMDLTQHMAVGTNLDYEWSSVKAPGADKATVTNNQFDVREFELWPLVGAFQGNFGVFSEIDASPTTASQTPTGATLNGGMALTHGELVYVRGNSDRFFSLRGGLISAQGYGAGDQWLDDSNIQMFDQRSANYNQDTLVTPLGANEFPQLGVELGLTLNNETYVTVGNYNGIDGTAGLPTSTPAENPALSHNNGNGATDYKLQVDQFLGSGTEVTAVYYRGVVPLADPSDPTNATIWNNHYSTWRLYLTQTVNSHVDLLAGAADGLYEYRNTDPTNPGTGSFTAPGAFVGANYYVMPHLTLSSRLEQFTYSSYQGTDQKVQGATMMVGIPMGNTIVNIHYDVNRSDTDGMSHDGRVEWRLIF